MKIINSDNYDNYQISGAAWTEHSWHFSSRFKQETRSAGEIFQPKFTGCDQSDMVIFVGFPNSHATGARKLGN